MCIVIVWVIITLINYYYTNFFFLFFIWLGMSLGLLIISVIQLIRLIRENKNTTTIRVMKLMVFSILFFLTFNKIEANLVIENFDWKLMKDRREEIVKQVKNNELKPNASHNNWVCKLPFEFPVVSNGGNDILISKNEDTKRLTVTFWIFRNFFEAPSTQFIYTDDWETIRKIEDKINKDSINNWKIEENWYRTFGELYY